MSKVNLILFVKIIAFIACVPFLTSCLKDAECYFTYQLHVKINEVPGVVDSVSLYVFNADESLKEVIEVSVDTTSSEVNIPLDHLESGDYTFVAWGNLKGNQVKPENTPGDLSLKDAISPWKKRIIRFTTLLTRPVLWVFKYPYRQVGQPKR